MQAFDTRLALKTTADLTEGANLLCLMLEQWSSGGATTFVDVDTIVIANDKILKYNGTLTRGKWEIADDSTGGGDLQD